MRLAEDVKELGAIEQQPILDGRNMVMVLSPTRSAGAKSDAKDEDITGSEEAIQADRDGEDSSPARNAEPQPREEVVEA
jgi:translation initiation factor IF-3